MLVIRLITNTDWVEVLTASQQSSRLKVKWKVTCQLACDGRHCNMFLFMLGSSCRLALSLQARRDWTAANRKQSCSVNVCGPVPGISACTHTDLAGGGRSTDGHFWMAASPGGVKSSGRCWQACNAVTPAPHKTLTLSQTYAVTEKCMWKWQEMCNLRQLASQGCMLCDSCCS